MTKLSKNFSLEELISSSTAKSRKIDNTPPTKIVQNLTSLANNILQPIRDAWGAPIIIGSAYRCPLLNSAVGGAKSSDHMYGCAADIHTQSDKPEDNKKLFNLIIALKDQGVIKCRQIIDEYGYNWIHISQNNEFNQYRNNQVLHLS